MAFRALSSFKVPEFLLNPSPPQVRGDERPTPGIVGLTQPMGRSPFLNSSGLRRTSFGAQVEGVATLTIPCIVIVD